jgi:hypothetical protein
MTLRHQVSLILRFGSRSVVTKTYTGFRHSDFAPSRFRVILLLSATLTIMAQFSFRFRALRGWVFPALLFIGAILLLHFFSQISITQLF